MEGDEHKGAKLSRAVEVRRVSICELIGCFTEALKQNEAPEAPKMLQLNGHTTVNYDRLSGNVA